MIVKWSDILKHMPLCYKVLHRLRWRGDYDELVYDVGVPTLARCLRSYDENKGAFSTYAYKALYRSFAQAIVASKPKATSLVVDSPAVLETPELDHVDHVQYLLDGLSKYDRALLILYFWKGLNYDELAEVIGVSKSTISSHIRLALNRCRAKAGL